MTSRLHFGVINVVMEQWSIRNVFVDGHRGRGANLEDPEPESVRDEQIETERKRRHHGAVRHSDGVGIGDRGASEQNHTAHSGALQKRRERRVGKDRERRREQGEGGPSRGLLGRQWLGRRRQERGPMTAKHALSLSASRSLCGCRRSRGRYRPSTPWRITMTMLR